MLLASIWELEEAAAIVIGMCVGKGGINAAWLVMLHSGMTLCAYVCTSELAKCLMCRW